MANTAQHEYATFDDIMHFWAKERPDGLAFDQDGRVTTFAEADRLTRQMIALLQARGIAPHAGHAPVLCHQQQTGADTDITAADN